MDERFEFASKKAVKEDVINLGKLLSDKSKIDILEYVSKYPSYGKVIADELNLSTATISYHIKLLLMIGFLKAEVDSNKIYYNIDKARISSYIEDVRKYFMEL